MKIHLIGIGGMGMAALAKLLVESGNEVTGSDTGVFPPMSTVIESLGITPMVGYGPENIPSDTEAVVIGNVITRANTEAKEAMNRNLKCYSMPEALYELFLKNKDPIVVSGTHGKTTTTLLLAKLLEGADAKPGFFAGGIGLNWNSNAKVNVGELFVLEGDEYDSAFFDKRPKFVHYAPKFAILTSLEFDHADIYPNLKSIEDAFMQLISLIPKNGTLIANIDDKNVNKLIKNAHSKVVTYGLSEKADYRIENLIESENGVSFKIKGIDFKSPLMGVHNARNAASAIALCAESKLNMTKVVNALADFKGVARRQQVVGEVEGITVIDDFAHHPTAVRETILAVKAKYPGKRLWSVFEPRSNTTRRKLIAGDLAHALLESDRSIIGPLYRPDKIPENERLNPESVARNVNKMGGECNYISKTSFIEEYLIRKLDREDIVLFMSNGQFDNLPKKITEALKKRKW